jgi:hypothetical protein
VFIATGAAILLVLAASAIVRITDRTPGTECYPGAGFNCDAPIKR